MPLVIRPGQAIRDEHFRRVEEINAAKWGSQEKWWLELELKGWLECLQFLYDDCYVGALIMDADMRYIEKGIDRPMCGGVFLSQGAAL